MQRNPMLTAATMDGTIQETGATPRLITDFSGFAGFTYTVTRRVSIASSNIRLVNRCPFRTIVYVLP